MIIQKNKYFFSLIMVLLLILFSTCSVPGSEQAQEIDPSWQIVDSSWQFITSSNSYLEYAFWHTFSGATDFPLTVNMEKISGNIGMGYGVIFCYNETNSGDASFYLVRIASSGYYNVFEANYALSSPWSEIVGWTGSNAINTGLNVNNTVSVDYSDPYYAVSINGTDVYTFDPKDTRSNLSSGVGGFLVNIGSSEYEDFPNVPEEVRFRMTSPVSNP